MVIVDAHAHVYSPDEYRYPAITFARRPSPGIGTLDHLREVCRKNGVAAACAIQTASFYGWDNRYLCDLSRAKHQGIAPICSIDPESPGGPVLLRHYVREYGIRGLRCLPTSYGQLDVPVVRQLWGAAAELGIVVNVQASHENVEGLESLLRLHPDLAVVFEHSLSINNAISKSATLNALRRLSKCPNAYVEISDMATISGIGYPFEDVHDLYLEIIEAFGPPRCVWGSCFPTEFWVPHASYADQLRFVSEALPLSADARRAILGETAQRLWFRTEEVTTGLDMADIRL
jgi:predicted TIM-barrel fold metal-dependent hydrolase